MNKKIATLACALLLLPAQGFATTISFSDPVGDHTGNVDVTNMDFVFDNSGSYSIDLTATGANPFSGEFRVNINLWNVTLDEFFQDSFNDFDLGVTSQTSLSITGNSPIITDWLVSHTIATSTLAGFGNPAGSSFFRSSVANLPFAPTCDSEDVIGIDGCSTTVPAVPVPAAVWLFGSALIGLAGFVRRRKRA